MTSKFLLYPFHSEVCFFFFFFMPTWSWQHRVIALPSQWNPPETPGIQCDVSLSAVQSHWHQHYKNNVVVLAPCCSSLQCIQPARIGHSRAVVPCSVSLRCGLNHFNNYLLDRPEIVFSRSWSPANNKASDFWKPVTFPLMPLWGSDFLDLTLQLFVELTLNLANTLRVSRG